jgi:DNA repair exonuclease SbcCD nuclease subunit
LSIRLIHTADWQIGKPFGNIPDEAAVPLRQQRIDTIKKIATLATEERADAILVAGDVFDSFAVAERTLLQTVHAMSGFKGPWLLMPGNHDPALAEGVWRELHRMELPNNIVLLDKAEPYIFEGKNAVVLPAPLQRKHDSTDVSEWFDTYKTEPSVIRIGLAHGSVDDRLPERGEAPNTISARRAQKAELDYLALGDWHGTHRVDERTWYAGTPETDRFKDNDSGNVLLIQIEAHGERPDVKKIPVGHYRWRQLMPSLHTEHGSDEIQKAITELGEPFDNLVIQLTPRGTASLHTRHQIAKVVASWDALVRYLDFRDEQLVGEASEDDLAQIGSGGFVGDAVRMLRDKAANAESAEEADAANLALQILFVEHKQLAGKK